MKAAGPLLVVAAAGLVLGAAGVQRAIDARFGTERAAEAVVYLLDGRLLRRTALGFPQALADVYWLRALQYFGATHHHVSGPTGRTRGTRSDPSETLFRVLNIITDLDPRFSAAYTNGAHFLGHHGDQAGLGRAIRLLEKGIRANPRDWHHYFDLGFVYYFYARDYETAARVFAAGAVQPGAPVWMGAVTARSQALSGDRQTARALAIYLRDTATEASTRQGADFLVLQLDALDRRDELEVVVSRYQAATGRFPASWEEVVNAGALPGVPEDPAGVPYALEPQARRVRISHESPLGAAPGN